MLRSGKMKFIQIPDTGPESNAERFDMVFDLEDDPRKNDEEFALGGKKGVTQKIYDLKLAHCAEVLADLNADIVGLCEVENRFVLEELNREFIGRNYDIVHFESPDRRGIDCALLYDAKTMTVLDAKAIKNRMSTGKPTRDILYVKGEFESGMPSQGKMLVRRSLPEDGIKGEFESDMPPVPPQAAGRRFMTAAPVRIR